MTSERQPRLASLLRAPLYDRLDEVAARLAAEPGLRDKLLETPSGDAFRAAFRELAEGFGLSIDWPDFDRHVALLLEVDEPYYFANPQVGFSLRDFSLPIRLRIVVGWLVSQIAAWFDTQPLYRCRWWPWPGRREPSPPAAEACGATAAPTVRDYSAAERQAMQAAFDVLGDETWRLHVDWEDQEYGPLVYDLCKHNDGAGDVGYLESILEGHAFTAASLGTRIDGRSFRGLHRACTGYMTDRHWQYQTSVRELWRPKDWADADLYDDIEPEHLRLAKFRAYEVLAMKQALFKDRDAFARKYPLFAAFMQRKLAGARLTAAFLNREFLRFRVCYFDRPYDGADIARKVDERFHQFYEAASELDAERRRLDDEAADGARLAAVENELLREIARLHRWCEYLRPFNEGNTRFTVMILDKLLVEFGFLPVVLAQRNDALFRSDRGWRRYIVEGMQRTQAIRRLHALGVLDHVLSLQPNRDRRRAARA
ncbi:MAG: hypothetical protein QF893_04015 [Alphaproteobacteria bacterium]|nr:hypothetical protein [Alphaproteobacteria bacterium]